MSDLLGSVRIKIDRAKEHLANLDAAIKGFEARKPFKVITDIDTDPRYEIYRFIEREPISDAWSAVIGDCIHNLRSALDHLAVALVLDEGGTPTEYTAFPIGSDETHFETSALSRINGARSAAIEKVRKLKPYGGTDSPLFTLHRLDILDKHKAIIPVAAAQGMFGFKWDIREAATDHLPEPRMLRGKPLERKFPLKNGDELLSYQRKVGEDIEDKTEFDFGFEISFGEGQILDGEPILATLKQYIEFVEGVVDAFATG